MVLGINSDIAESRVTPLWPKVEVSISILPWCNKAYQIYADSGV